MSDGINNNPPVIGKKYMAVFVAAVFISWIFHELSHCAMGTFLGYKMAITLNASFPLNGHYSKDLHYQLITAAGPVFTLCEAIFIFILMKQRRRMMLYPFLFICFYMRFLATVISIRKPNDEARISTALGIGKFTLPLIITAVLFFLLYKISKQYGLKTKFNLVNFGLAILFSSILILADMYFKPRLI